MTQTPVVEKILPISPSISSDKKTEDFLIEPKDPVIVREIIKKYLANVIFKAFLESAASEHGARMTAMDSATNNAREVIRKLTLQYNRARQAAITKELIEIISGAEAL